MKSRDGDDMQKNVLSWNGTRGVVDASTKKDSSRKKE